MALCGDPDRAPLGLSVPQAFLHAGAQAAGAAVAGPAGAGPVRPRPARRRVGTGAAMQATQSAVLNSLRPGAAGRPLRRRDGQRRHRAALRLPRARRPRLDHPRVRRRGRPGDPPAHGAACTRRASATRPPGTRTGSPTACSSSDGSEPLSELARVQACVERADLGADQGRAVRRSAAPPAAAGTDRHAPGGAAVRAAGEPRTTGTSWRGCATPGRGRRRRRCRCDACRRRRSRASTPTPSSPTGLASNRRRIDVEGPQRRRRRAPAATPPPAQRPLEGLKVVDFMWAVAGPTMSRLLADAGATVVRVESATKIDAARAFMPFFDDEVGVERSALFNNLNAGKLGRHARPEPARGPGGGAGPVRLGRRGLRGLLARGPCGPGASTTSSCGRSTPASS